jgi:hypothetical protein
MESGKGEVGSDGRGSDGHYRDADSGSYTQVFYALGLGAVMMILGGVAELLFGLKSERRSLESIARPLTAAEDRADDGRTAEATAVAT